MEALYRDFKLDPFSSLVNSGSTSEIFQTLKSAVFRGVKDVEQYTGLGKKAQAFLTDATFVKIKESFLGIIAAALMTYVIYLNCNLESNDNYYKSFLKYVPCFIPLLSFFTCKGSNNNTQKVQHELKKNEEIRERIKKLYDSSKNEVALVFNTTSDYNNSIQLNNFQLQFFEDIGKKHSVNMNETYECIAINREIDSQFSQKKSIRYLIKRCHGKQFDMKCSNMESLCASSHVLSEDDFDVRGLHYSKLAQNAVIILHSCSTGKSEGALPSIAEWMQFYAGPRRKVIAPNKNVTSSSLRRNENGEVCFVRNGVDITAHISYKSAFMKVNEYISTCADLSLVNHVKELAEVYADLSK